MQDIVFLTSINRSGSTFLLNQLSKSSEVCICPEAEVLYDIFLRKPLMKISKHRKIQIWLSQLLIQDYKFKYWGIPFLTILRCFENARNNLDVFIHILKAYQLSKNPNSSVIIFKHTWAIKSYFRLIDTISDEYKIKWILLIRDVRAVYSSQKITISPFTQRPFCTNPVSLAHEWNYFVRKFGTVKDNIHIHKIHYEALILNLHEVMDEVAQFLKIYFAKEWILNKDGIVRELLTPEYLGIHKNIDEPPKKESIRKWEELLTRREQAVFARMCKKNLNKYDYQVATVSFNHTNTLYILYEVFRATRKYIINILIRIFYKFILKIKRVEFITLHNIWN